MVARKVVARPPEGKVQPIPDNAVVTVVYDKGSAPPGSVSGTLKSWNQDGYLHLLVNGKSFCIPQVRIVHIAT